jgi:hypothetical protein
MNSMLMNGGLIAGAFLVLASPALGKRDARGWFLVLVAAVVLDGLASRLGADWPLFRVFAGSHWNWSGKILSFAVMLMFGVALIASRHFKASDIGLTLQQAPGTARAVLFGVLPFLIVMAVLTAAFFGDSGDSKMPSADTIRFEATVPGLAEELFYRGVALALFDRMFSGRLRLWGAQLGYGAFATSIIFGLGHGLTFDKNLLLHASVISGVSTGLIGFFLAWLRLRTKSLVLPVLAHNAINLIFVAVPRLI